MWWLNKGAVFICRPKGQKVDTEVLDVPPTWDMEETPTEVRVANINGGDSYILDKYHLADAQRCYAFFEVEAQQEVNRLEEAFQETFAEWGDEKNHSYSEDWVSYMDQLCERMMQLARYPMQRQSPKIYLEKANAAYTRQKEAEDTDDRPWGEQQREVDYLERDRGYDPPEGGM